MANKQVQDVVEKARIFHRQLGRFYHTMSETASKERVKLLLDYMSRHEEHLDECLKSYEHDGAKRILGGWLKQKTESDALEVLENITIYPDMNLDEVVSLAQELDDRLIAFYKRMASDARDEEARELFQALLGLEKREKVEMVRNALEFEEV